MRRTTGVGRLIAARSICAPSIVAPPNDDVTSVSDIPLDPAELLACDTGSEQRAPLGDVGLNSYCERLAIH